MGVPTGVSAGFHEGGGAVGLEQGESFLYAGADGDLGRRKLGFGVVS